jgi:hypothetical protein
MVGGIAAGDFTDHPEHLHFFKIRLKYWPASRFGVDCWCLLPAC